MFRIIWEILPFTTLLFMATWSVFVYYSRPLQTFLREINKDTLRTVWPVAEDTVKCAIFCWNTENTITRWK